MPVGAPITSDQVSRQITDLAVQLRKVMEAVSHLSVNVNGQGNGLVFLEDTGYNATDAAAAQNAISYLNTIAGVYFGTATQATTFNFHQQLSQYWAGQ